PQFIVDRLEQGYYVNEVFENPNLISELIANETANGTANIAYFNSAVVSVQVGGFAGETDEIDGDPIEVEVERLVAKIVVTVGTAPAGGLTDVTWHVNGGQISDFEFNVGQRNLKMYLSPFNFPQDPNWTPGIASLGSELQTS